MTLSAAMRQTVLSQSDNDNNNVLHAAAKYHNGDVLLRLLLELPHHQPEDLFTKLLTQKNSLDRCCVLTACEYGNYRFLISVENHLDIQDMLVSQTIEKCFCELERRPGCTFGYNMLILALAPLVRNQSALVTAENRKNAVIWIINKLASLNDPNQSTAILWHKNRKGNIVLQVAVQAEAKNGILYLLTKGITNTDKMITHRNNDGENSIFQALESGQYELARKLLDELSPDGVYNALHERTHLYQPRGNAEDPPISRTGYNLIMMSLTLKDDLTAYHLLMEYDGYRQIEEDIDAMIVATQNEQWDAVHSIFDKYDEEENYETLLLNKGSFSENEIALKNGLKENDGKELLSNWLKIDSIKRYLGSHLQDISELSQAAAFAINSHYFPTKFFLSKRNKILKPLAIIFYNKFSGANLREHAEDEKDWIKKALVATGWNTDDIHARDEWTFKKLITVLDNELKAYWKKISFLFLCIMSHGEAGKIYGKDKAKDDEDMGSINKVLETVGHRLHHDTPKLRYFIVIFAIFLVNSHKVNL